MSDISLNKVVKDYESGKSIGFIAKELNTYPAKIYRLLKANGIKIRDRSECQKISLEKGFRKHPTKGKIREDSVKLKISEKVAENWGQISEEERKQRSERCKTQWENMPAEDKKKMREKAQKKILETSKEGSELERYLYSELRKYGFDPILHKSRNLGTTKLEIDLLLAGEKLAVEVDGPSHYRVVYSEEQFERQKVLDTKKNGILLSYGFRVIRLRYSGSDLSQSKKRKALKLLLDAIENKENYQEIYLDI